MKIQWDDRFFARSFFASGLAWGLLFLGLSLFQRADAENRIMGNYSPALLLVICVLALLALAMLAGLLLSGKDGYDKRLSTVLSSDRMLAAAGAGALLLTLGMLLAYGLGYPGHHSLIKAGFNRFFPLLLCCDFVLLSLLLLPAVSGRANIGRSFQRSYAKAAAWWRGGLHRLSTASFSVWHSLALLLLVITPFFLSFPLRYRRPVGAAGLFALMADLIKAHGFRLPLTIPYYGPDGIPFAYPPLGAYCMAFFTGLLGISNSAYLIWAPPLLSILSFTALFLFVRQLAGKRYGLVSVLLLFASPRLFLFHSQASGIVRGLAYLLLLVCLLFLTRYTQEKKARDLAAAVVLFALVWLTHLSYAVFALAGVFLIVFLGPGRFWPKIRTALVVAAGGLVLAAPWWITVLHRHGVGVFLYALHSHDNLSFLQAIRQPLSYLSGLWSEFVRVNAQTPMLIGLSVLGFFYLINRKEYRLPALFLVSFLISEGDRYQLTFAAILSAVVLVDLLVAAGEKSPRWLGGALLAVLLAFNVYPAANTTLRANRPEMSTAFEDLAVWLNTSTPADADYLLVTPSADIGEWLPYLAGRTPVMGTWGAEWVGTYQGEFSNWNDMLVCANALSLECLEERYARYQPDYLVVELHAQDQADMLTQMDGLRVVYAYFPFFVLE